jgi:hypothetical protein
MLRKLDNIAINFIDIEFGSRSRLFLESPESGPGTMGEVGKVTAFVAFALFFRIA